MLKDVIKEMNIERFMKKPRIYFYIFHFTIL